MRLTGSKMNRLPKFTPLSFSGSARETPKGFDVSIGFEAVSFAVEEEPVFVRIGVVLLVVACLEGVGRGGSLSSVAVTRSTAKATRRKRPMMIAKALFVAGERFFDSASSRLDVDVLDEFVEPDESVSVEEVSESESEEAESL